MSESVIPAVLLRALSEYKFVGHLLWRMADGKGHVCVKKNFHKMLPTYKKRAESRRQPEPSAGKWLRQPTAASQPPMPMTRPPPSARRQPTRQERETPPPAVQTLQNIAPTTITLPSSPMTAQIKPSPIVQKPDTPPRSPMSLQAKAEDQVDEVHN